MDADLHDRLRAYVADLFAVEDRVLQQIRANAQSAGLPAIHIKPDEAKRHCH